MFKNWSVDTTILTAATTAVFGEIAINFITSYGHTSLLGMRYGERGIDAHLTPIGFDLFLLALALANLFLARKGRYIEVAKRRGVTKTRPEFRWPRWVLAGGVAATVAANVGYGAWWGITGAMIAAFSAAGLFFTVEVAMLMLKVAAEEGEKDATDTSDESFDEAVAAAVDAAITARNQARGRKAAETRQARSTALPEPPVAMPDPEPETVTDTLEMVTDTPKVPVLNGVGLRGR